MIDEILVIPDTQIRSDLPEEHLKHLDYIGQYIVDHRPEHIICLGDFADMPSLSVYEKPGTKSFEGRRYKDDIKASKVAMHRMLKPLAQLQKKQKRQKKKVYRPNRVMLTGNHENRINRAIATNPTQLEGVIGLDDLGYEKFGWDVIPFLKIYELGGVYFSHYFINPESLTKGVITGSVDNRLNKLGFSFVMGHQQTFQYGIKYKPNGDCIHGLVCGAFYSHDEHYLPAYQGNAAHWRGAVSLKNVENGRYDLEQLSMFKLENIYGN